MAVIIVTAGFYDDGLFLYYASRLRLYYITGHSLSPYISDYWTLAVTVYFGLLDTRCHNIIFILRLTHGFILETYARQKHNQE